MPGVEHPGRVVGVLFYALLAAAPGALASVPNVPMALEPVIELYIEEDATVVVEGLRADGTFQALDQDAWRKILRVVARDPETSPEGASLPPLLGTYQLDDTKLRFRPRFPPVPGLVVEATFDSKSWNQAVGADLTTGPVTARHMVPSPETAPTTRVEAVYPATRAVPANLLRFYVHFSAPMSAKHVLPYIELHDADGDPVETAFVEVEGGLWDPHRTRLTLFVHPGRIKRGVGPNQVLGPVLEKGESYRLRIDSNARDDRGRRLAGTYEHLFRVGLEDHTSPDPRNWRLMPPKALDGPLRVELVEPADVALLQRLPAVVDAGGRVVEGRIKVVNDGSRFEFHPTASWRPGSYELRVPSSLEDASGNRVDRLFEEAAGHDKLDSPAVSRPFIVAMEPTSATYPR